MKGIRLLYGAAALMAVFFAVHVLVDWAQYDPYANSAPFRLWIYVDALLYLVPAALMVTAGIIASKKISKKKR
jgi:hypothetical protein